MADSLQPTIPPGKVQFNWIFPFLLSPRKIFPQILTNRAVWLTPLLFISLLAIIQSGIAISREPAASDTLPTEVPTPENGTFPRSPKGEILPSLSSILSASTLPLTGSFFDILPQGEVPPTDGTTPVSTTPGWVTPLLTIASKVIGIWACWFLITILLFVAFVVSGGHNSFTEMLNLTAWSSLPFALQFVFQILFSLVFPSVASASRGLSGLLAGMQGTAGSYLSLIFQNMDIFLIWQIILIMLGVTMTSRVPAGKARLLVLGAVIVYLLLVPLPAFTQAQLALLQSATQAPTY
jgi:hypothetical protein